MDWEVDPTGLANISRGKVTPNSRPLPSSQSFPGFCLNNYSLFVCLFAVLGIRLRVLVILGQNTLLLSYTPNPKQVCRCFNYPSFPRCLQRKAWSAIPGGTSLYHRCFKYF
jgi:hypothetical protein